MILRKMTAALTLLALMCSIFTLPVSAADSGVSQEDRTVVLLESMGVLTADSSGSYLLNKALTRAEFAKMIVTASAYKDIVASTAKSSPFLDVKGDNWAAPYIKIAVNKGLMSGYSDGTFRPDGEVTLEQAANAALKLLGYEQSDFAGAFPYAQINLYESTGLSENIVGGIGTVLTKGDAVNLIYNMMGTDIKDGSKTYAETLGYTLNASGEVDYADVVSTNMQGPYTVKSSGWASELGMNADSLIVYKNGTKVTAPEVQNYDILYYSKSKGTVWVYDDRVTGVYEKASPSQNAVTSITVSGKEYTLESTNAFTALSSTGTLKIGDGITLLLGKNGGVADAVSAEKAAQSTAFYVTETGNKVVEDADGNTNTSYYFKGVTPLGGEVEYTSNQKWVDPGDMVSVSYENGSLKVVNAAKTLSGTVQAELRTIGSNRVSANAAIIDTYDNRYSATSLSRLDGMELGSGNVLYYKAVNGEITELVLNDATGDVRQYGLVTSVRKSDSGGISSITYNMDGQAYIKSVAGKLGPMALNTENGEATGVTNLRSLWFGVTEVTGDTVTADGKTWKYSYDVKVYQKDAGGSYTLTSLDFLLASSAKKNASFYYDSAPEDGGRIRMVIIPES